MAKENLTKCSVCGAEMSTKAKVCPSCGAKNKKPFYKAPWFWILIVAVVIIVAVATGGKDDSAKQTSGSASKSKVEVTVTDFSKMDEQSIKSWAEKNKVNCKIEKEYSDSVAKGSFISQSVKSEKVIHEGDNIKVVFSLGKEPSTEFKNALKKAESYSSTMHMSKKGVYDQLTSQYGGNFEKDAAQYAVDNMEADWNANALEKAKSYQETMNMSKNAVYKQLVSSNGGKFTKEEAQYAVDHLDD